ncbi:hypothetical protein [Nocardia sp. 348MFTsu5.1]|uniref:hypothetical protein n=1 Tax=Nocardia sp. 348MFTsu5.1 TaxID=1172185 RepID=UPI00037B6F63|nr:hypothetical protein [Nocardia sp. 348MFTsu5.1]
MTTAKTATDAATDAATAATASLSNAFDGTSERIQSLNEKLVGAVKQTGNLSLDTYEQTLSSVADFEEKVGAATKLEWVGTLTKAHASFVTGLSSAWTSAARDVLK